MAKKIQIISKKIKSLEEARRFSSYIGKKTFSKSGEYVGKVTDLIVDKGYMQGVIVNSKKTLFIDREFFETDSEDTIMLSIEPVTLAIGKQVFDSDGKKIGKVIDLERETTLNSFNSLIVKDKIYKRAILVPKKDVKVSKHSIILNKSYSKEEDEKDNNK